MRELTTFEIYLLTLIGIAFCSGLIGYLFGTRRGYNEGFDAGVDAQLIEVDMDDEEEEIGDEILDAREIYS